VWDARITGSHLFYHVDEAEKMTPKHILHVPSLLILFIFILYLIFYQSVNRNLKRLCNYLTIGKVAQMVFKLFGSTTILFNLKNIIFPPTLVP
jgi:hypothetical protein